MSTIEIIKEAVIALKDRTGSSIPAINKWLESEKKVRNIRHVLSTFSMGESFKNTLFFAFLSLAWK